MEEIKIIIRPKHFKNSNGYTDQSGCPLALAIKDQLKIDDVTVNMFEVIWKINQTYQIYTPRFMNFMHGTDTWQNGCVATTKEPDLDVDVLIKRAKQKKKVGNYIVTLIKR